MSMDTIDYWRRRAREAQHSLVAAYQTELTPGLRVTYYKGSDEVVVEVVKHTTNTRECYVRNPATGVAYTLRYDRIHRIVNE
jgi:hypothetical protein